MTDGVVSDVTAEQIAAGFNFVDAAGAGYKFERASNQKLKQLAEHAFSVYEGGNHSTGIVERTSSEFLGLAIAAGTELTGRGPGPDLTSDEIEAYDTKIAGWRRDLPRVATPA
jgi:hypothetical protein